MFVNAMRQHPRDEEVNRNCCRGLWGLYSLARSDDGHAEKVESGGAVDVVQAALKTHPRLSCLRNGILEIIAAMSRISTRATMSLEMETIILHRRA